MIIEFSIGNFRSFKEMETLSMAAAPIRSKDKELDISNVTVINDKLSLLRSKAIYGANASGKSNIIRAFFNFERMVRSSIANENVIQRACDDFVLVGERGKHPVFFQLIFVDQKIIYRYGFELMQKAVVSEWLYSSIMGGREIKLFTREKNKVSVNQSQFNEAKKFENLAASGDSDIFQSHSLFLTATAAVGVKLSKSLQSFINLIKIIERTENAAIKEYSMKWWTKDVNRERGIKLLKGADIGIESIDILSDDLVANDISKELQPFIIKQELNKMPKLLSLRKIRIPENSEEILLETIFDSFESEGTKKLFHLIPFILNVFELGGTLWIDEFDARLHPLLTKKIASLFHSTDTNPHGAQLIFATHDTNLLKPSFLRRDQICFVEKDQYGASHLKTLVEYKGVRNDASYDKDYLQGRYGAVPFLNELDEAVEKSIAANG